MKVQPLINLSESTCKPLFVTPSEAAEEYFKSREIESESPRQQKLRQQIMEGIYYLEYLTGMLHCPEENL